MIDETKLREVAENARERFDERVEDEGRSARALGWDTKESMQTRFAAAADLYDFEGKTVLDVGCGFGDFFTYLEQRNQTPERYVGVDISDRVLEEAEQNVASSRCEFERRNVLIDPIENDEFDIVVEFGLLNFNFDSINNEQYARRFIDVCWPVTDNLLLNALSSYREGDWEFEEFVYYYDPEKLFSYAQEYTRDVTLKHDFEPIPQKELILLLS